MDDAQIAARGVRGVQHLVARAQPEPDLALRGLCRSSRCPFSRFACRVLIYTLSNPIQFSTFFSIVYGLYLLSRETYVYPAMVDREFPYVRLSFLHSHHVLSAVLIRPAAWHMQDGLYAAHGFDKRNRDNVFTGIDPEDEFEGSQAEYYMGPKHVTPKKLADTE